MTNQPPTPVSQPITATNIHAVRYHAQCGRWGAWPVSMTWHPHRPLLATGSTLDHRRVQDATVWTPEGHLHARMAGTRDLGDLGWSWDGRLLATATDTIGLWTATGELVRTLPGQRLTWNPTTYHLVTSTDQDGRWWLWDVRAGTTHALTHPAIPVRRRATVVWSPRGTYLMGCWTLADGTLAIMVWDREGQELVRTTYVLQQPEQVLGCIWHPHEQYFLMQVGPQLFIFELQGMLFDALPIRGNSGGWNPHSTPCQWSPDGAVLATSTEFLVQLWTTTGQRGATLDLPGEALSVAWNPGGDVLATTAWRNQIQLWTRDGALLRELTIHKPELGGAAMQIPLMLAWDHAGEYLAASLRGCTVHVWGL